MPVMIGHSYKTSVFDVHLEKCAVATVITYRNAFI